MKKSTSDLPALLLELASLARARGMNDTQWAESAGVRKETLSRLRTRSSCDFATLQALANAVGVGIGVDAVAESSSSRDRLFPVRFNRAEEQALLDLAVSQDLSLERWCRAGPSFFMAGFAVLLASLAGFDRSALLALAERLHAGSSRAAVFEMWLHASPLAPSRFIPMLEESLAHAA